MVIVLDALDECAESDLQDLMRTLKHVFWESKRPGRVRLLLTGRPYEQVVSHFCELLAAFPYIRIPGEDHSEAISQEVNCVITERIKRLARSRQLQPEIQIAVTERGLNPATGLRFHARQNWLDEKHVRFDQQGCGFLVGCRRGGRQWYVRVCISVLRRTEKRHT